MVEFVLHAGQHKTGSTSVQAFLRDQRDALLQRGVLAPVAGASASGSHRRLLAALTGRPHSGEPLRELRWEVEAVRPQRVLLSAELAKRAVVEGSGDAVVDGLRAAGATSVLIVVYIRDPFALVSAAYSQRTHTLNCEGRTYRQFAEMILESPCFAYGRFLDLARRPDVRLVARTYDASARAGVIRDLLQVLDLDPGLAKTEPRLNRSIGPMALEAMRRIRLEVGPLTQAPRLRVSRRLEGIAHALGEAAFWAVDETTPELLAPADALTDVFARQVWNAPWREAIGQEIRPHNVFDPDSASRKQLSRFKDLYAEMHDAARGVLAEFGESRRRRRPPAYSAAAAARSNPMAASNASLTASG